MTPRVAIADDFLEAYARIPRSQQKKVRTFMEKFQADPKSNAINYEKIHDVRDPRVRTVRIDQKYRAVILHPDTGNVYVLVWVDNHDEAMDWAKDRSFEVNPATGSLQVINVTEVERIVAKPEKQEKIPGLLDHHNDDVLISFGLPVVLLPAVRAIENPDDLSKLCQHLPAEAAEALLWLAEGYDVDEVREAVSVVAAKSVDTSDIAAALDHPDSKRRFITIQSDSELRSVLEAPLEKWRIFLHPSQERLVAKDFNGPARVLGGPGTGKTVVAIHRARQLAKSIGSESEDRILFTTYTGNLANNVDENLKNLCGAEYENIHCTHLHAWAVRFLAQHFGVHYSIAQQRELDKCWESAIFASEEFEFEPTFLQQEWEQVVQHNDISELAEYLRVSRKGRGKTITRPQRAKIWKIFQRFRDALDRSGKSEWSTVIREARQRIENEKVKLPYTSVVVDEGQDFNNDEWRLIRAIVPEHKNDLFIVGDSHQRIYGPKIVLSQCGVNIRGRSSRLRINYRTTEQIRTWSMTMLKGLSFDDLDGGVVNEKGYRSLLSGPSPEVHVFDSLDSESEFLTQRLTELLDSRPPTDICIVARTNKLLKDHYAPLVESLGVQRTILDKSNHHSGVALGTMHRVKGLEFPVMILVSINESYMPLRIKGIASDPVAKREHENKERSLLFVAATRARDVLLVTTSGSPSRFISN